MRQKGKKMFGNRLVRLSVGFLVLAAIGVILWPHAKGHVATSAVINAPLITIRAPVDGTVSKRSPELSSAVLQGQQLLEVRTRKEDRVELFRLNAQVAAMHGAIGALSTQETDLRNLQEQLLARQASNLLVEAEILDERLVEAAAERDQAQVLRDQALSLKDRLVRLSKNGSVSTIEVENSTHDLNGANARLVSVQAKLEIVHAEARGFANNSRMFQGGDRDYVQERLDEVVIRLVDLQSRLAMSRSEVTSTEALIENLQTEVEAMAVFQPKMSSNGVIWSASRGESTPVVAGDALLEILDCDRRFVEVNLPESLFEDLVPGTEAEVRLFGSNQRFTARVISRFAGNGGAAATMSSALKVNPDNAAVTVFLSLDPVDLRDPEIATSFCDVGRRAEVYVPRESLKFLTPFLDQVSDLFGMKSAELAQNITAPVQTHHE